MHLYFTFQAISFNCFFCCLLFQTIFSCLLGDRGCGKSHLLARLRGVDMSDEPSSTVALGYTFLDIVDDESNGTLDTRIRFVTGDSFLYRCIVEDKYMDFGRRNCSQNSKKPKTQKKI